MKNNYFKKTIFVALLIFSFSNLFSQENQPKPYEKEEFPQYAQDIRRFEIISFGSLPFVFLDSVLVYSGIKWGMNGFQGGFPNIFNAQSGFNAKELTGIILTSVGISLCIALTDLLINRHKRNAQAQIQQKQILILPEELNPPVNAIIKENKESTEKGE